MSDIWMVTDGATLKCSLGTKTSALKVPQSHGAGVGGKNQAVISDYVPMQNIFPFGLCTKSSPPVPCMPSVCIHWINGKLDFKVNNELALLNICVAACMQGGIIKIQEK